MSMLSLRSTSLLEGGSCFTSLASSSDSTGTSTQNATTTHGDVSHMAHMTTGRLPCQHNHRTVRVNTQWELLLSLHELPIQLVCQYRLRQFSENAFDSISHHISAELVVCELRVYLGCVW